MSHLYIGLLSGTSMDAVDSALVELDDSRFRLLTTHRESYPSEIRSALQVLSQSGKDEINQLGQLDRQIGFLFAKTCNELIEKSGYRAADIEAIGSHGQTIRHQPQVKNPFTLQIGDPNVIAEVTGVTTVADFRRRDMAKGGQGAPLTPAFHQFAFRIPSQDRVIINIGGIANLTFLPGDKRAPILGFDCGPGNTLLDNWCSQHLGTAYDKDGHWAKHGRVCDTLLTAMQNDPYFKLPPPKSTGSEYFNLTWLENYLQNCQIQIAPEDVQATLAQFTAWAIVDAVNHFTKSPAEVFLCGGGVYNTDLVARIHKIKGRHIIEMTSQIGLDPQWVEAVAFAWLARQTLHRLPGNLPDVTGAQGNTILGGVYFGG